MPTRPHALRFFYTIMLLMLTLNFDTTVLVVSSEMPTPFDTSVTFEKARFERHVTHPPAAPHTRKRSSRRGARTPHT